MKLKTVSICLLAAGVIGVLSSGCATSSKNLKAQAQITEAQAREIALTKAPGGTIKTGELEKEKGHLIYSFDIATPGTKDITEVHVDARTGKVIAVDKESPAKEEKEMKEEKKEKEGKEAKEENEENEEKSAKAGKEISEAKAREIALSKVPGGKITKADHDNEGGKWMWSFDISTPGNTENIAIDVDAKTGEVLSIEHEKASSAAAGKK